MNYRFLLIIFSFLFFTSAFSQDAMRSNQMDGYIISADGTRTEVGLEIEDEELPWTFQTDVRYFDRSLLTGDRVRKEHKTVAEPGEVVEYGFDGRRFIAVIYNTYAQGGNIFKNTLESIKGDGDEGYFAEVVTEGDIQLLRFYLPPEIDDEDYDSPRAMERYIKDAIKTYDILIYKDGLPIKPVQSIKIKTYFGDCDFVMKKFKDKRYKINPSTGFKKVFSGDDLSGTRLENAAKKVAEDYQSKCGK